MKIQNEEDFRRLLDDPRRAARLSRLQQMTFALPLPEEYEAFAQALTIRSGRARVRYLYKHACERIDRYNQEHGICCRFHDNTCAEGPGARINGCCCDCYLQTHQGCPTANLACKFFFCTPMKAFHPLTPEDFPEFALLSRRQRYMITNSVYMHQEEAVFLIQTGSILLFMLYTFFFSTPRMLLTGLHNKRMARAEKNKRLSEKSESTGSGKEGKDQS